jgi:16S rRNA (uracil1498-N3)-methyltransferase
MGLYYCRFETEWGRGLKRFFIDRIKTKDGIVRVTPPESGHITRVLRMGPGDRLILMDGAGARYQSVIRSCHNNEVTLFLERPIPAPPACPIRITLLASLLKSGPMETLIQKTSELGVHQIQPFVSSRTVVRLPHKRVPNRLRRWKEIAKNAAKQADRDIPAEVRPPGPFDAVLSEWQDGACFKIFLWEGEDTQDLKEIIRNFKPVEDIIAVVGPEGGFSDSEVHLARSAGYVTASLGRRVLRAETAAMALVALLQYEWGDLSLINGS